MGPIAHSLEAMPVAKAARATLQSTRVAALGPLELAKRPIKPQPGHLEQVEALAQPPVKAQQACLEAEYTEKSFAGEARGLGQQWAEENESAGAEDLPLKPSPSQIIRRMPRPPSAVAEKGPALAPLCVVLDLDHTLVYSQESTGEGYDFCIRKGSQAAYVWKRPGVDALLSWLRQARVEAVVYTAASSSYAEGVSRHLDPDSTLFRRRLSRRDCPLTPPAKDLLRLGCDLRRTVLVDDSLSALRLQPDNGIPVTAYTGGPDEEMPRVRALLEELVSVEDVRKVLHSRFRVAENLRKKATRAAASTLAADAAAVAGGAAGHAVPAAGARTPAPAAQAAAARVPAARVAVGQQERGTPM